jgi:hypothetical protein
MCATSRRAVLKVLISGVTLVSAVTLGAAISATHAPTAPSLDHKAGSRTMQQQGARGQHPANKSATL